MNDPSDASSPVADMSETRLFFEDLIAGYPDNLEMELTINERGPFIEFIGDFRRSAVRFLGNGQVLWSWINLKQNKFGPTTEYQLIDLIPILDDFLKSEVQT